MTDKTMTIEELIKSLNVTKSSKIRMINMEKRLKILEELFVKHGFDPISKEKKERNMRSLIRKVII